MSWPIKLLTEEEAKQLRAKQQVFDMARHQDEFAKKVMHRLMHEMNALNQWVPGEFQKLILLHGRKGQR